MEKETKRLTAVFQSAADAGLFMDHARDMGYEDFNVVRNRHVSFEIDAADERELKRFANSIRGYVPTPPQRF